MQLTRELDNQFAQMEALGWDFLPYAPNEWQWMKFDAEGWRIAIQGDQTWAEDCKTCGLV